MEENRPVRLTARGSMRLRHEDAEGKGMQRKAYHRTYFFEYALILLFDKTLVSGSEASPVVDIAALA